MDKGGKVWYLKNGNEQSMVFHACKFQLLRRMLSSRPAQAK
jgi:hypothetical protein